MRSEDRGARGCKAWTTCQRVSSSESVEELKVGGGESGQSDVVSEQRDIASEHGRSKAGRCDTVAEGVDVGVEAVLSDGDRLGISCGQVS